MATQEMETADHAPSAIEVFCSYSHKDETLREELDVHLNILQAAGVITSWQDHAIPAGKEWASEIDTHLNSAQIILLLISPDFLASKYAREVEVKRALERAKAGEATVISVLLRDVDWHGSPLSKLQALPKGAKPITSWPDRDQALNSVAVGIRKVAEEIRRHRHPKAASSHSMPAFPRLPQRGTSPTSSKKYSYIALSLFLVVAALYYGTQAIRRHWPGPKPPISVVQPKYCAGVDLGSKGVKGLLFSLTGEPGSKKGFDKSINTTIIGSMKDGRLSEDAIKVATEAVQELINEMRARAQKENLPDVAYLVVGSSAVGKAKNRDSLVKSVKEATGIDMEFIDARREAYFGLLFAVPEKEQQDSVYLNIGSGNTKAGCLDGGSDLASFRTAEIEYGSVTGRIRGAEKNSANIMAGIQQVMREDVQRRYHDDSMNSPCLLHQGQIYWTGGAAWATATFMHPEMVSSPYVNITRHDLDAFLAELMDQTWDQRSLVFSFPGGTPLATQAEIRDKAELDRKHVVKDFVREDLVSGVSILKVVLENARPSATITFVREDSFLYGYAMEKYHPNSIHVMPGQK
jgi:TIR domain/Ppx/GppA phosphatase family